MSGFLGKLEEPIFAITRFVFGVLFACHGAQKLFGALGGKPQLHSPMMLTAGIIEFFGGLLIAIGLAIGIAAFLACGEMAVAYFTAHFPHGVWPIENRGEPAVLYCFFFLFVVAHASGRFSMDTLIRRKKVL